MKPKGVPSCRPKARDAPELSACTAAGAPNSDDPDPQVAALIETLHETGKRLEQLTGGEVDSVVAHDGRAFLLQHAQDQLRHAGAAKQAGILDALPASIALLDPRGTILAVNEAWRRFSLVNQALLPGHAVGTNYLTVCDLAKGAESPEASRAAAGMRKVLSAAAPGFSMEYSCHSPTEQRWFLMTVFPMAGTPPSGTVVMHVNITERKLAEAELQRFVAAMDSVADQIYITDRATLLFVHVNDAACRMQGKTREQLLALGPADVLATPRAELERAYDAIIASGKDAAPLEMQRPRADGTPIWVEVRRHAKQMGGRWMIITLVRDITDQRHASEELQRSETLKGAILEASLDCLITVDHDGRIVEFNPAAESTFGYARSDVLGRIMAELIVPSRYREAHHKGFAHYLATGEGPILGKRLELQAIRADGSEFPIELSITPIDTTGPPQFTGFIRDITLRRETDQKLKRLNRVYAVLSGINSLIVRVKARDELFTASCRIAVEQGGFHMAWIGLADREAGLVRPLAFAGDVGDYFEVARLGTNAGTPDNFGLAGRALTEMTPIVSNDVSRDPRIRIKDTFARSGVNSVAMVPLVVGSESIGVLALYSTDAAFFDGEEMRLIVEMASNISLALEHIEEAAKLHRMTRVNAMLSAINGAIVRIRDRKELFQEACRIVVETGGLPFAWISLVDEAEQRCLPVAWAGAEGGYLEVIKDRFSLRDDPPGGHGISASAIRGRHAVVVNDATTDGDPPQRARLAARGIGSLAAFPMLIGGRAVGAVILHAVEAGFFDEDEVKLLTEMAGNLSFALEHIEKEEKVRRLTRVHSVLSGINALIVRAVDRDQLFREACRIAIELGGFRMAWIALHVKASGILEPIASAGDVCDFFESTHLADAHNQPGGAGLPGRAVREMAPMISNDVRSDPSILRKRKMKERGIRSAAHIPLPVGAQAIGILALYSTEAEFFDDEEVRLLTALGRDIGVAVDHLDKKERLDYLAYYDALTGLPNRTLFLGRVAQGIRRASGDGNKLALLIVDLERFKDINDTLGRPAGDTLLKQVAQWLLRAVGDPELLAHLGADRFAVLVPTVKREGAVGRLLERALKSFLDHAFDLNGGMFRIAAKVGVAIYPRDGANADSLFTHAEAALKKAKSSDDRWLFYKPAMTEQVAGKLTLENQLRQALDRGEFVLHYQPKVNLASGKVIAAEALIRWNDPRTGLVPPGRFIPVLEATGLIHDVGRWALRQAIADYLRWRAAGLPAVPVAVNVSPLQLRSRDFIAEIRRATGVDAHAPAGVELEITESVVMEDVKHSIIVLQAIRAMGVTVAIDDFGTGFSSLSYLAKLPVDTLKIDRSFIVDMTVGPEGLALVSTIINLAHSLKLKVVAEGVETDEQSRLLRLLDCDEMQGFLFSKPIPSDDFEARFLATAPG